MKNLTLKRILKRHANNLQDAELHKVIENGNAGSNFSSSSNKEDEIPTQYLLGALRESEEAYKAGRYKSFATGKDALDYLDAKIITNKKNK